MSIKTIPAITPARAAVVTGLEISPETPKERMALLVRLRAQGEALEPALKQFLSLAAEKTGAELTPLVEAWETYLKEAKEYRGELSEETMDKLHCWLEPLGESSVLERTAAARKLEDPSGRFPAESLYPAVKALVESGEPLEEAVSTILTRRERLAETLDFGKSYRQEENLKACTELFFGNWPVEADFEQNLQAITQMMTTETTLKEASKFLLENPYGAQNPVESEKTFQILRGVFNPTKALETSLELSSLEPEKTLLEKAQIMADHRRHIFTGEISRTLFEELPAHFPDPQDLALVRAQTPRLARFCRSGLHLNYLCDSLRRMSPQRMLKKRWTS